MPFIGQNNQSKAGNLGRLIVQARRVLTTDDSSLAAKNHAVAASWVKTKQSAPTEGQRSARGATDGRRDPRGS